MRHRARGQAAPASAVSLAPRAAPPPRPPGRRAGGGLGHRPPPPSSGEARPALAGEEAPLLGGEGRGASVGLLAGQVAATGGEKGSAGPEPSSPPPSGTCRPEAAGRTAPGQETLWEMEVAKGGGQGRRCRSYPPPPPPPAPKRVISVGLFLSVCDLNGAERRLVEGLD